MFFKLQKLDHCLPLFHPLIFLTFNTSSAPSDLQTDTHLSALSLSPSNPNIGSVFIWQLLFCSYLIIILYISLTVPPKKPTSILFLFTNCVKSVQRRNLLFLTKVTCRFYNFKVCSNWNCFCFFDSNFDFPYDPSIRGSCWSTVFFCFFLD